MTNNGCFSDMLEVLGLEFDKKCWNELDFQDLLKKNLSQNFATPNKFNRDGFGISCYGFSELKWVEVLAVEIEDLRVTESYDITRKWSILKYLLQKTIRKLPDRKWSLICDSETVFRKAWPKNTHFTALLEMNDISDNYRQCTLSLIDFRISFARKISKSRRNQNLVCESKNSLCKDCAKFRQFGSLHEEAIDFWQIVYNLIKLARQKMFGHKQNSAWDRLVRPG